MRFFGTAIGLFYSGAHDTGVFVGGVSAAVRSFCNVAHDNVGGFQLPLVYIVVLPMTR